MNSAKKNVHCREVNLNMLFENNKRFIAIVIALKAIKLNFKFVLKIFVEFSNIRLGKYLYEFEQIVTFTLLLIHTMEYT